MSPTMAKKSTVKKKTAKQAVIERDGGKTHAAREGSVKYLNTAKSDKQDEFYTQLSDIEKELRHYTKHFKGKTVLCNCDDPQGQQFLSLLLAQLREAEAEEADHHLLQELRRRSVQQAHGGKGNLPRIRRRQERQPRSRPGRNRHPQVKRRRRFSQRGMRQAAQASGYRRHQSAVFVVPGVRRAACEVQEEVPHHRELNAITYKEIFKLIKENKIWLGVNSNRNFSGFIVPEHYAMHGTEARRRRERKQDSFDEYHLLVHKH